MMKKVYIAHPFRGKKPYTAEQIQKNTLHVTGICRAIFRDMTDVVPVSPVHAFGFADPFEDDQHKVLDCCGELLHACDEMWVFGDWLSSMGCIFEVGTFCRRDEGGIAFCTFVKWDSYILEIHLPSVFVAKFMYQPCQFFFLFLCHNHLKLSSHKTAIAVL